jgi:hypothetical protein
MYICSVIPYHAITRDSMLLVTMYAPLLPMYACSITWLMRLEVHHLSSEYEIGPMLAICTMTDRYDARDQPSGRACQNNIVVIVVFFVFSASNPFVSKQPFPFTTLLTRDVVVSCPEQLFFTDHQLQAILRLDVSRSHHPVLTPLHGMDYCWVSAKPT